MVPFYLPVLRNTFLICSDVLLRHKSTHDHRGTTLKSLATFVSAIIATNEISCMSVGVASISHIEAVKFIRMRQEACNLNVC